jgi:SAM-dependent methyltransferase
MKSSTVDRSYFDCYHNGLPYEETYQEYFCAKYIRKLIKIVWKVKPPYRLLDAGSANGLTLAELSARGIDAWGVENNRYIHSQTPKKLKKRNLLADVRELPFPDDYFDFVYETCLAYLPPDQVGRAIQELHRVTKHGVIFASLTKDMNPAVFRRSHLLLGMKLLITLQEWGDLFCAHGFEFAVTTEKTLTKLWRCEEKYNQGDDDWYPDKESLRYCFYTKVRGNG